MKLLPFAGLKSLAVCGVLALTFSMRANLVGPYTVDANTLHLWHIDETALNVADAPTVGTPIDLTSLGAGGGNAVGATSYPGFGKAYSGVQVQNTGLFAKAPANSTSDNTATTTFWNQTTGAFTYECMVRIDFDPAVTNPDYSYLVTMDQDTGNRPFIWALNPMGTLPNESWDMQFVAISPNPNQVRDSGALTVVQGHWYHAAVTFDGVAAGGNLKMYWTDMGTQAAPDTNATTANLVFSTTLPANLLGTTGDFVIGSEARNAGSAPGSQSTGNWLGLIDEVRISDIARDATGMMFVGAAVSIVSGPSPTNLVVNVGQPASFSVTASGAPTVKYQWRTNGIGILGATNASYTIPAAQLVNAGNYTVIVSNNFSAVTSSVATLTVQTALNLTWLGQTTADWDTTTTNWLDSLANPQNFLSGDGVTFDATGSGQPTVTLIGSLAPTNVVVDAGTDYMFTGTGGISGATKLVKNGTGALIVDVNNTFTGGTEISGGVVQLGNATARGSLGSGAVSNGTAIVFARSDTALTANNNIRGPGALTNNSAATAIVTLTGSNTFSGDVVINSGMLTFGTTNSLGYGTNILVLNPNFTSGAFGTRLGLAGGIVVGANVSTRLTAGPGARASIYSGSGTNTVNGPIFLDDLTPGLELTLFSLGAENAGTRLVINGPITTANSDAGINIRGTLGGTVVVNGTITLVDSPFSHVSFAANVVGQMNSSGNSWRYSEVTSTATARLGINNAFPVFIPVYLAGTFDLNGFNQQLESISDYDPANLSNSGIVGSSSTTSDSVLTLMCTSNNTYYGTIRDVIGSGTRKVGFTLNGGNTYTLTNHHTFSGDTTILAGTLALANDGTISNTVNINLASGTVLDVSARNDAAFTLGISQTLKGNGAFNVIGTLTNRGTIELKLNKAGATLTNDSIHGLTSIDYGGTLKLTITASPALTTSDSFPLFFASSYSGAFTAFTPATPGSGLAWDPSTLATDGVLRITTGPTVNSTPTNITSQVSNNTLTLSWPSDHTGWRLQTQTNSRALGISNNWFDVPGATTTNQVAFPIDATKGAVFFRMIYP